MPLRFKMTHIGQQERIHQHSGWLIPAAFLFAILLLSGLFLGWYMRPGPKMAAVPTDQSGLVGLMISGQAFTIPANYIQNSAAAPGANRKRSTWQRFFRHGTAIPTPMRASSRATDRIRRWSTCLSGSIPIR